MSKTRTPNRTRPLDRDGDGNDGGSLPGNETAPMADAAAPETAPPATETPPETAPAETETPPETATEAVAADAGTDPWTRDDLYLAELLVSCNVPHLPQSPEAIVAAIEGWSDPEARNVEGWAEESLLRAAGAADPAPSIVNDTFKAPEPDPAQGELLTDPAAAAIEAFHGGGADEALHDDETGDGGDTFTPDEVAAGHTPVVEQEGEAETTAAAAATTIDPADPLAVIETETAPVAVRLKELSLLTGARFLYKSADGFSQTYAAPFVSEATVEGWVAAGLAYHSPTAGIIGGVKATAEAHAVVAQLRRQLASEAEAA